MKKVSIIVGLLAFIGIGGLILLKNQKNNANTTVPITSTVQGTIPNNGNNVAPINQQPNIKLNSSIPSPEGTNSLPQIVRPTYNPQMKMTPPPEVAFMQGCQGLAKGNPEIMRKCFEGKVQENITAQTNLVKMPDGTILNVAEYTKKVKSGEISQINNASQSTSNVKVPTSNAGVFK